MGKTLYQKVWDAHTVGTLSDGRTQLFIGTHLIHEVTSPQAFGMLRDLGLKVKYPSRTFATIDHIVPTINQDEPADPLAADMIDAIRKNCDDFGVTYFDLKSGKQGIVHVVGPEQGITQPGSTIACGDSHTATHGAFGAIAFGIGTTQVRDVLATQTMAMESLKVRKIEVNGKLRPGVYAKDVTLHIIRMLGAKGGIGYAYEYSGTTFDNFSMEERMTVCNMAIEGGARCGYVNPDETTFEFLKNRPYSPTGDDWEQSIEEWKSFATDSDAEFDDIIRIDAEDIEPTVTWGISPDHGISIDESIPDPAAAETDEKAVIEEALAYMKLPAGTPIKGIPIDVAFIGSCTNGRLSDFREAARLLKGHKVADGVKAIAVPGSQITAIQCEKEGLDKIFQDAGFEWRAAGCSMCLAMNPDKLVGDQICASSSNRNFKGRQGSPMGRTVLMSPIMVAAAAVEGHIADARETFNVTDNSVPKPYEIHQMKFILSLVVSLLLLPVFAQKSTSLAPIDELLKIMKFEQTVIDGGEAGFVMVEKSLAGQDLNKEEMGEVKDAFIAYMTKVASDPQLKIKTKAIYEETFTDHEITALISFYKTPTGKKSLEVMPTLTGEIMGFSQQLAQKHVGSFQNALTKILERRAARGEQEDE